MCVGVGGGVVGCMGSEEGDVVVEAEGNSTVQVSVRVCVWGWGGGVVGCMGSEEGDVVVEAEGNSTVQVSVRVCVWGWGGGGW